MSEATVVTSWYQRNLTERNFVGQALRKMRRFYLGTFQKGYIEKSIAETRTGECHRCGACCELIYRCPFLGRDSENLPYCRVYGDLRPANCHNYPFDTQDAEIDRCGYKFKPKPAASQSASMTNASL
jgi:hypothetical protein